MSNLTLFLFVVVVSVFLQNINAIDTQQFLAVATECKTAEEATEMDFFKLKMNVTPKTRPMKCLTACLFEKLGKIKNNQFDAEGILKELKSSTKLTDKVQKSVTDVIMECNIIQDSDRCEYASKIADCLIAGAAKRGLKSGSAYN